MLKNKIVPDNMVLTENNGVLEVLPCVDIGK